MTALPKNREQLQGLRELLRALTAEGRAEEAIDVAMAALSRLFEHNAELMLKLAQFRREQSGRRGEKIDTAQLLMMLELCPEEDEEETTEPEAEGEDLQSEPPRQRPRRRRPPKELPGKSYATSWMTMSGSAPRARS